tara:strand:- start:1270 stop:1512 length:243 start_codon:yes stop_codon:yes gene_type:complete
MANLTTTGFATEAVAVTPHNTDALTPTSALYVGVGGDLTVTMADSTTDVVFKNVPSGTFLPIAVTHVKTATTATDILAIA